MMYAFVSNEYSAIVCTATQLDFLQSVFSYPKFIKVNSVEEAQRFFAENDRSFIKNASSIKRYGKRDKVGYITVKYFISDNSIFCNVDTRHFGFIKLRKVPKNVAMESSYSFMKLKFKNINLDDELIAHHCLAISNILRLYPETINIELILPDISVYLAITKYSGKNFSIRNLQSMINSRLGRIYYSIGE